MNNDSGELKLVDVLTSTSVDPEERLYDLCLQIENIVTSYDDRFDAFAEAVQNSVDAVIQQWDESAGSYEPFVRVHVDCGALTLTVMDNGCGVSEDDFTSVFRPNFSLKRRLRHQNARGEKGAGVVFLQFAHPSFVFETKTPDWRQTYTLTGGDSWFKDTLAVLHEETDFEAKADRLPADPLSMKTDVSEELDTVDRGSRVTVMFGEGSSHPDVRSLFNSTESALDRLEYICRTRTALGYFRSPDLSGIHLALQSLRLEIVITFEDGQRDERVLPEGEREPGFLFPHEMARRRGSFHSQFTDPRANSELLYGFFDAAFFAAHLPAIWANQSYRALIERFDLTGYFSYGYRNTYYEDITAGLLQLADEGAIDEAFPQIDFIQVNGGFQIAVREYPNGRRHSFLHRSGAEDKSRTFVLFNFRGDYKPDYGRKNIADEVRPLVLDLSKALIRWATRPTRKENLATGEDATPYGATGIEEARETLAADAERIQLSGAWLDSTKDPPERLRVPKAEAEVVGEFVAYVASGHLPGFCLYGLSSRMLDSLFDYHLVLAEQFVYDATSRPLGLIFIEGRDRRYERQWLEFKPSTDLLAADIAAEPGSSAKKWFTTINLLVCENVDDALDGYTIDAVTADNVNERKYFGVTHILRSHANQDHAVQVIALAQLRVALEAGPAFIPARPAAP